MQFNKLNKMPLMVFFTTFIFLFFTGCPGPSQSVNDGDPVLNVYFDYSQPDSTLYFGVLIEPDYLDKQLDSIGVHWFGTDTVNSPDEYWLNDRGESGDILKSDNLFSIKVSNNQNTIKNYIALSDTGNIHFSVRLINNQKLIETYQTFQFTDEGPVILSVSMPDTMFRPDTLGQYSVGTIIVEVADPNGPEDIQICYLMFQKPDSSWANKGNPIELFDDGREIDFFWDEQANDSKYSRYITIGNTNPLGTYHAFFYARDYSGNLSPATERLIEVVSE